MNWTWSATESAPQYNVHTTFYVQCLNNKNYVSVLSVSSKLGLSIWLTCVQTCSIRAFTLYLEIPETLQSHFFLLRSWMLNLQNFTPACKLDRFWKELQTHWTVLLPSEVNYMSLTHKAKNSKMYVWLPHETPIPLLSQQDQFSNTLMLLVFQSKWSTPNESFQQLW